MMAPTLSLGHDALLEKERSLLAFRRALAAALGDIDRDLVNVRGAMAASRMVRA